MLQYIDKNLNEFYTHNLTSYGPGAQGVGWKNEEAQQIRFEQLAKLFPKGERFTVNDLGCGVGDLAVYLETTGLPTFSYTGYDVLEKMITLAREKHASLPNRQFLLIKEAAEMLVADFTVASGIFNLRYANTDEQWLAYILQTLHQMDHKSEKGFAFNALTTYSDPDKMQDYLYYSDPLYIFDYCKKHFSRNVALLHDYNQYDFTILVRKTFR